MTDETAETVAQDLEAAGVDSAKIAWELERIADAGERLCNGPLTFNAVVTLLRANCNVRKEHIERVLRALPTLKKFLNRPENQG